MSGTNQGFTLVELMVCVAILGILLAVLVPNVVGIQTQRAKEAAVKSHVHLTQLAVEDAAAVASGHYPGNVAAFKHSLPDTAGFKNPFTSNVELPQDGAADDPGEVGYELTDVDRYVITGYGADRMVLTASNGQ